MSNEDGLIRYYLGTSPVTGIGQMYEDDEGPWVLYKDARAALAHAAPEGLDGTETRCPLVGAHEHAFRGPHRFREWPPKSDATEEAGR